MNRCPRLTYAVLGGVGISLLSACMALPDLKLAKQAKGNGDLSQAEANFRPLADQGYVDAEIGMADLLVHSALPAQQAEGEAYYRQAMDRSPVASVRLGKWLASKPLASPAEQREAEQRLREGLAAGDHSTVLPLLTLLLQDPQRVNSGELDRQLAQWAAAGFGEAQVGKILLYRVRGDYPQHVAEIQQTCEQWLSQVSECYPELAAIYQGQGASAEQQALLAQMQLDYQADRLPPTVVQSVAKVLSDNSQGQADPTAAKALLLSISADYPDALCSLAVLLVRYPEQGSTEEMLGYLKQGASAGSSRSLLMLGQLYLKGQVLPADPVAAEQYLLLAVPTEPKAHMLLGKLYSEGPLGNNDPDKALLHFLAAARGGNPSADVALAQLFGSGEGVKINAVYAYAFASLAKREGLPQGEVMMQRITPLMQPQDYPKAESLLRQELQARGVEQLTVSNQIEKSQGTL